MRPRSIVDGPPRGRCRKPTWRQCFDSGMTAPEAAAARGVGRSNAYSWSAAAGVTWPKPVSALACPVRIRDVLYPSMSAAADCLRVNQATISRHLTMFGHADDIGVRRPGGQIGSRARHLENPVRIGGREWPSRKRLADYIGWSSSRVCRALSRGSTPSMVERLVAAIMSTDAKKDRQSRTARRQNSANAAGILSGSPAHAETGIGSPEVS